MTVSQMLPGLLLGACLVVGLPLVLLGLPGLWVMVLGVIGYGALTQFTTIGPVTIFAVTGLAFLGEVIEWQLGFKFARRYGGSRRAGWGALLGGLVGAGAGIPIPLVGSVIGAFVGSFVGAALFEFTRTRAGHEALRVGWGAVLGRAAGAAAKVALGVMIAVIGLFAAFHRG